MAELLLHKYPMNLLPPQAEVFDYGLLDSGFNCVLQMPTGSGKTWLAEQAIEKTLQQNLRAVYLSPLRSLATELSTRWQKKFPNYTVGIFTGDYSSTGKTYPVSFRDAQVLIMTPEKLDACTRFWRNHWAWIPEVDLIVVDELHLLGDAQRGARLEGAISRMRRLNPFLRVLGLSATLGNRQEISEWLNGVDYVSNWRPIPIEWRFARFQKATEKPELLLKEVSQNISDGGKSLVFVQSRRRAEVTSAFLNSHCIRSYHHHAGLGHEERRQIEQKFLSNEIDVLVATATLEMGLNLPVRQVVLYDVQTFNGTEFQPLTTNSVWQRIGRAGRPGLDEKAEAVLIVPIWDRPFENYELGKFEPILSALSCSNALSEQIIAEVSSGMSRTKAQVIDTFSRSLAAKQNNLPDVKATLNQMLDAGMLIEGVDEDAKKNKLILRTTRLGRIASRHFLSPATVLLFKNALDATQQLTFFDLLLICACAPDCDPILPCDYEELENLSLALSSPPSHLLKFPRNKISRLLETDGKRLLASLKMALAAREWSVSDDKVITAEKYNCYPFEIARLRESLIRLLRAMSAITQKPMDLLVDDDIETAPAYGNKIRLLLAMVDGGLDEYAATLTLIDGVGPKTANRLKSAGINDLLQLAKTNANNLEKVPGVTLQRLKFWIKEAKKLVYSCSASDLFEIAQHEKELRNNRQISVDPYRLRRALELTVSGVDGGTYYVTGGTEPHTVQVGGGKMRCDCIDYIRRNGSSDCKHILAIRLARGDSNLKQMVEKLKRNSDKNPIDLFDLWFAGQKSFTSARTI